MKEVEMHYSEYKRKYPHCSTVSGSYNKKKKTIIVYVPEEGDQRYEIEKKLRMIFESFCEIMDLDPEYKDLRDSNIWICLVEEDSIYQRSTMEKPAIDRNGKRVYLKVGMKARYCQLDGELISDEIKEKAYALAEKRMMEEKNN